MDRFKIPGGGFTGGIRPTIIQERADRARQTCTFCQIVDDAVEADVVLETERLLAFLDRRPVFKGHILLVPREHLVTLLDLPPDLATEWTATQQRLIRAVMDELGAQGAFVASNNIVSQSVPHLHQHIVPRTKGDGLRGFFWPRQKYADGEARSYAERLRTALG